MSHAERLSALAPLPRPSLVALAAGLAAAVQAGHLSGAGLGLFTPGMVVMGQDGVRLAELDAPVPPEFVAPEVLSGAAVGPASEVYAWGKVVLYAATGSASADQDLRVLPQPLRGLVARAMAERPELRPHVDEIQARLRRMRPARRLRRARPASAPARRTPWLWAGLAAGLVLMLVAGGALVLRSDVFGGGAAQAAGVLRADQVFAAASKAAPGAGLDQSAMDAAVVGRTVVVVGTEMIGTAGFRPLFMVSSDDGETWQVAPSGPQKGTGDFPRFVTGGTKGWVALPADPSADVTAWTSEDGKRWDPVPADGVAAMADHSITGLVATRDGFAAAGALDGAAPPTLWTSADGKHWEHAATTGVDLPHGLSSTLVAHGDQVIVTGDPPNTTDRQAGDPLQVVARSADGGRTWQPGTPPTGDLTWEPTRPFGERGAWYATDGRAFYAAYSKGAVTELVRSADAASWQPVGTYDGKDLKTAGLAVGPTGFYLLSRDPGGGTIAHSADGSAWTPLGSSKELAGSDLPLLQPTATGLLARHDRGGGADPLDTAAGGHRLRLLTATPGKGLDSLDFPGVKALSYPVTRVNALEHRDGHTVAAGQSMGMASAWWSDDDGATWTRSSLETPGELTGLASGPQGWLAVGGGHAYVSRDGRTWQPAASEAGKVQFAAAAKDSYLLLGLDAGKSAVWRSTDLSTWRKADVSAEIPRALAGGELGYAFAPYFCPEIAGGCVWFSADGLSWKQVKAPAAADDRAVVVGEIAVGSDALVVTGSFSAMGSTKVERFVARSGGADGVWKSATLQEGHRLSAIGPAGEGWTGLRTSGGQIAPVRSGDGLAWEAGTSIAAGDRTFDVGVEIAGTFLAAGYVRTMTEDYPIVWRVPGS